MNDDDDNDDERDHDGMGWCMECRWFSSAAFVEYVYIFTLHIFLHVYPGSGSLLSYIIIIGTLGSTQKFCESTVDKEYFLDCNATQLLQLFLLCTKKSSKL